MYLQDLEYELCDQRTLQEWVEFIEKLVTAQDCWLCKRGIKHTHKDEKKCV